MGKVDDVKNIVSIADTIVRAGIAVIEARRRAREEDEKKRKEEAERAANEAAKGATP